MENRRTWLAVLAVAGFVALSYVAVSSQLGQSEALKAFEVDEEAFRMFIAKYGKTYTSEEYQRRFQIYRDNMAYIRTQNAHNPKLTLGETPFVDLTHEEFTAQYLSGYKHQEVSDFVDLPTDTLPASVDWVMAGAVTPVKNQGQCGSCWAFSITGSIEGIHYLTTKDLVSLSEQQLVDCSWESPYDNYGCNGGYLGKTFQYVVDAGGLETEASYPYTALEGECAADKSSFAVSIKSYANVWSMSETALMAAVAQQPVSVAVDASEWLYYTQGIIDMCGSALNHAVLAVGYGTATDGTLYWLVKNSWGPYWGEDGYVRILRDPTSVNGGVCGIAIRASYPTV